MSSHYWKPTLLGFSQDNDPLGGRASSSGENGDKVLSSARTPRTLSIHAHRDELLYLLEECSVLVLAGETGCGKSTQVPQFLHKAGWTQGGRRVVCTQPRRMAAITVATQVASQMKVSLGEEVGYAVRFDSRCDLNKKRSVIKYCTDGLLLRETLSDPLLSQYSVVMVDESHERSLHSDVLLGLLKKILRKRPKDFRIIVASASMDARLLENFFEAGMNKGDNVKVARVLNIRGKPHDVDMLFLDRPCKDYVTKAIDTVLSIHASEGAGDVIVFLPGVEEIDKAIDLLNEKHYSAGGGEQDLIALPLYGSLPYRMQMRVFESVGDLLPSSHSKSSSSSSNRGKKRAASALSQHGHVRKVIFATNIAETSVTIDGVRFVVDSGFSKMPFFDVESGVDSLITCVASKASAVQRAGRAGRTNPGKCFRLYTEDFFNQESSDGGPPAHGIPDMQRTDITWAVLQLKAIGIDDVLHFDFPSPPSPDSLMYALELLHALGAIDQNGVLTELGMNMCHLPLNPRMSKCLLEAQSEFGCLEEMLSIAAMCSIDYPFIGVKKSNEEECRTLEESIASFASAHGDHMTLLNVYNAYAGNSYSALWCKENMLQTSRMQKAREIRTNLSKFMKNMKNVKKGEDNSRNDDNGNMQDGVAIRKCLVSGYFANAAQLQSNGRYKTLRGDFIYVLPHRTSILNKFRALPEWIIYHEVISATTTTIREVSKIHPRWLLSVASHYYDIDESKNY